MVHAAVIGRTVAGAHPAVDTNHPLLLAADKQTQQLIRVNYLLCGCYTRCYSRESS